LSLLMLLPLTLMPLCSCWRCRSSIFPGHRAWPSKIKEPGEVQQAYDAPVVAVVVHSRPQGSDLEVRKLTFATIRRFGLEILRGDHRIGSAVSSLHRPRK